MQGLNYRHQGDGNKRSVGICTTYFSLTLSKTSKKNQGVFFLLDIPQIVLSTQGAVDKHKKTENRIISRLIFGEKLFV